MPGFWETLIPGGLGAYGYSQMMDNISDRQDTVQDTIGNLTNDLRANTSFTPYGVMSNLGNTQATESGLNFALSPEQLQQQQMLAQGGMGMMGNVMMPRGAREQEVYDRIRATQTPEEARQQALMRQGLASTGRLGISSLAGGGGSPEQLAFETARAEAMNRASLGAMSQANAEQLQDYNIGSGMLTQQYQPLQQLYTQMGLGGQNAQLAQRGQLANASMAAQLGLGGLTADQNFENIRGKMFGDMISAGLPIAGGIGQAIDNAGGLWASIQSIF